MSYIPFYEKLLKDNKPSEQREGEGTVLQPQPQPDIITPFDGGEGEDGKTTELQEVTITAPKGDAKAPAKVETPASGTSDFRISEEQLGEPTKEAPEYETPWNKPSEQREGEGTVLQPQPQPDIITPFDGGENGGQDSAATREPAPAKPVSQSELPNKLPVEGLGGALDEVKLKEFLVTHPWAGEEDLSSLYDKYKNQTPAQMLYDIAKYRESIGKPLTLEEKQLILQGRDPNKSKKQVTNEKRRAYWADVINELGNVLAHFYNYGRAKAGSPAATITPNKSDNVARLRAADMAMRQRGYNDYVNAMANAEKRKQAREDEMRKLVEQQRVEQMRHNNQMELEKLKWMSPEYKKKIEAADIDIRNKAVQNDILELEKAFKVLRNETARNNAVDFFIKKNKGSGGSKTSTNKTTGKDTFGDKSFNDPWQAYQYALSKGAKPAKRKKIDYVDGTEKEVDVTSKDFKNYDYSKWLDAVGVKTN